MTGDLQHRLAVAREGRMLRAMEAVESVDRCGPDDVLGLAACGLDHCPGLEDCAFVQACEVRARAVLAALVAGRQDVASVDDGGLDLDYLTT